MGDEESEKRFLVTWKNFFHFLGNSSSEDAASSFAFSILYNYHNGMENKMK